MTELAACPVCAADAECQGRLPDASGAEVLACVRCGEFWIAPGEGGEATGGRG